LQRDAQPLAHLAGIFPPGVSQNRYLAGGWLEKSFENFDGRSLPCSVGTEQAKTFAGLDFKIEPAHGFDFAVIGLAEIAALDGYGHVQILT